ncbi:hypothetical protein ACFX13_045621 [Malus domestica]
MWRVASETLDDELQKSEPVGKAVQVALVMQESHLLSLSCLNCRATGTAAAALVSTSCTMPNPKSPQPQNSASPCMFWLKLAGPPACKDR